jgi:hypothetical protein
MLSSTPKTSTKVTAAVVASAASICLSLAAATGPAIAIQHPDPVPGLVTATAVANPGPPNYPEDDPHYQANPTSGAGPTSAESTAPQWRQAGASALAGIGATCGVIWLYRRHHITAT